MFDSLFLLLLIDKRPLLIVCLSSLYRLSFNVLSLQDLGAPIFGSLSTDHLNVNGLLCCLWELCFFVWFAVWLSVNLVNVVFLGCSWLLFIILARKRRISLRWNSKKYLDTPKFNKSLCFVGWIVVFIFCIQMLKFW